jgi:hypothetical protein
MDPEDFDTYNDDGRYDDDPNPYEGTYAEENGDFDEPSDEEDGDEPSDEPSDEEVAEWEAQEDAGLDAAWEDRISGVSGFEADY